MVHFLHLLLTFQKTVRAWEKPGGGPDGNVSPTQDYLKKAGRDERKKRRVFMISPQAQEIRTFMERKATSKSQDVITEAVSISLPAPSV